MCDPATLAISAAVVTAVGQGTSAIAQSTQAKFESRVAGQNARMENERAADAYERGRIEDRQYQQRVAREASQQRVAMAANGLDVGFGSAQSTIGDTLQFGREDALTIRENAARAALGFDINAANYMGESRAAKMRGTGALVSGAFNVGSTALGGATQYRRIKAGR